MSLRQWLLVELDDGSEFKVEIDGRDIRAWEAETGLSAISDPTTISQMTLVSFYALRRQGAYAGEWDEFEKRCVSVSDMPSSKSGDAGRPTRKVRTAGSSSP